MSSVRPPAVVEADHLAHDRDAGHSGTQHAVLRRVSLPRRLFDLVAADPAQVVAAGVEEQRVDQLRAFSSVGGSPGRRRR